LPIFFRRRGKKFRSREKVDKGVKKVNACLRHVLSHISKKTKQKGRRNNVLRLSADAIISN